jgi:hypothetical protein
MFEFEFSYDSDRLAEIKDLNHCPSVFVTVSYNVYEAVNYDTPLGSDKKLAVGNRQVEAIHAEGFGDVENILDLDLEFMNEVVTQLEKSEPQMLDFARGKM